MKTKPSQAFVPCLLTPCRVVGPRQATASGDNFSLYGEMEKVEMLTNLDAT